MCSSPFHERFIYQYLFKYYKERGNKNFYFKAIKLQKTLGINAQSISKSCQELRKQGKLDVWRGEARPITFLTNFNGGEL